MYNKGVNSMLMYVLSLVLCALFGALAAVYVGYRHQYTKSGDEVWYDVSTAYYCCRNLRDCLFWST